MAVLTNPAHEAYCHARVYDQLTKRQAYIKAFTKDNYVPTAATAQRGGNQIEKRPDIQDRMYELNLEYVQKTDISKADLKQKFEEIFEDAKKRGHTGAANQAAAQLMKLGGLDPTSQRLNKTDKEKITKIELEIVEPDGSISKTDI